VEDAVDSRAERRPVELVVGDETRMLLAAAAVEANAIHGRMRGAGQALERAER
jgi:hypothetical protein